MGFLSENAKLINERNRGWHNHELPDELTSHSHTQGPYAHLREAEAEAERQERYIESLEAERDQWKAGTFPGWTRDDVYKELAGKYRELEAERDELRGALERAIARRTHGPTWGTSASEHAGTRRAGTCSEMSHVWIDQHVSRPSASASSSSAVSAHGTHRPIAWVCVGTSRGTLGSRVLSAQIPDNEPAQLIAAFELLTGAETPVFR